MRLEKTVAVLTLARALAGNFEGMTLDEMAALLRVGRRTAERMRDAVEAAFGPLEREDDGRKARFRLAARSLGNFASAPTTQELAELENAARVLEAAGNQSRAAILRSLRAKIGAALREADRRRLSVDVEAQLRAEAFACAVGPGPLADPAVLTRLREALLAGCMVKFDYGTPPRWRKVVPYGLLFGPRAYLVARVKSRAGPVLFRLDEIKNLEVLDEPSAPPPDFDLRAYAERSFGVFQEEPQEVVLRFAPSAAPDARAFLFHPTQSQSDEPDGSLTVRFSAGGFLELVHHLMTWGPSVTIVAPKALEDLMRETVAALHAHYCAPVCSPLSPCGRLRDAHESN
jgi:predicted DNA-binding transcriptional regulator YafY